VSHWHLTQAACCFASAKRLTDPGAAAFLNELGWILVDTAERSPGATPREGQAPTSDGAISDIDPTDIA
jgi:hypothetical protein